MTISEYNTCVDEYSNSVFRFVLKHIGEKQSAEDIIQDVFEKMWLKRETIDAKKAKSYLFTSSYHTLVDYTRKSKRSEPLMDNHQQAQTLGGQYSDLNEILHTAINKLPKDQKAVVLLRDYEGYSYAEIGEITNLSEAQVKVYIYRARLFLKQYLVKMEYVI